MNIEFRINEFEGPLDLLLHLVKINKMEIIEKPETYEKPPKIKLEYDIVPPKEVLNVTDCELAVGEGEKRKVLIENLNFNVRRGEKVAIVGPNGIGKTSILKMIQGIIPHEKGRVNWTNNIKIAYFEQENTTLNIHNTVMEELHRRFPRMSELEIRKTLGSVLLTGENVFKPVGVISGGERAKIALLKIMLSKPNFLILDEPTTGLDPQTRKLIWDVIYELRKNHQMTVQK